MTEADALARLQRMLAHDVEPTLDATEVSDLLALSKLVDGEGRAPSDADWEPTFDLSIGAAEGWRWKAGKVVPRFGVSLDGETLQRQQMYAHCVGQAERYASKIVGNIGVMTTSREASTESFQ